MHNLQCRKPNLLKRIERALRKRGFVSLRNREPSFPAERSYDLSMTLRDKFLDVEIRPVGSISYEVRVCARFGADDAISGTSYPIRVASAGESVEKIIDFVDLYRVLYEVKGVMPRD